MIRRASSPLEAFGGWPIVMQLVEDLDSLHFVAEILPKAGQVTHFIRIISI
jgi:hypothetical protein